MKVKEAIEYVERDGWYLKLPGCVAAGETLGEVRELMRGALAMHLEARWADGDDIPVTLPGEVAEYMEVDVANPARVAGQPG